METQNIAAAPVCNLPSAADECAILDGLPDLTERRKADRERMAKIIAEVAPLYSATCEIKTKGTGRDHVVWAHIVAYGGARLSLDFDADSCQPDTFVMSWNIERDSLNKFRLHAFGYDSVNPYHQLKATQVGRGFRDLVEKLMNALAACLAEEAYV